MIAKSIACKATYLGIVFVMRCFTVCSDVRLELRSPQKIMDVTT
jgi:hypothetical protein